MRSVAPVGDEHMAGSLKCVDLARYLFKRLLGIILHRSKRAADYSYNSPFRWEARGGVDCTIVGGIAASAFSMMPWHY